MTKMGHQLVRDIMSSDVRTCQRYESAEHCARLMWEHPCGAIVVVDEVGSPVAIVTDRDLFMAAWTQGKRLAEVVVCSAMSARLRTIGAGDTISSAEGEMRRFGVRRLVVVDVRGALVGLLSFDDIARHANVGPIGVQDPPFSAATIATTVSALAHPTKNDRGAS